MSFKCIFDYNRKFKKKLFVGHDDGHLQTGIHCDFDERNVWLSWLLPLNPDETEKYNDIIFKSWRTRSNF